MADHYYITPFVGTGTEEDPFRPKGADEGGSWGAVDIRSDATVQTGYSLVNFETRRSDEVDMHYLGTNLDALVKQNSVVWISNNLGVSVSGLTIRQTIVSVTKAKVTVLPDPDGKKRIRLRGVVHEE